jgi:uncharacterized protein YfiM (DUF2279 family)
MRYLILAATLLTSPAFADSWSTPDKKAHFVASMGWGAGARIICQSCNDWQATALGTLPGLVKEIQDSRPGGSGFSTKDLIADIAGAYVGQKLTWLVIRKANGETFVGYQGVF